MSVTAPTLGLNQSADTPRIVLSYGLGLDSTALLLRWIHEPASRNFDLRELAVCSSMVGDEFEAVGRDVERHILPLLRDNGIRFIQVGRSERKVTKSGSGIVVFDDSTTPDRLHIEGAYTLGQEMAAAGTIPQLGGQRLCSVHAKGQPLDAVITSITRGEPYRHAIGFGAAEPARIRRDQQYNDQQRHGWYPLAEWGWDRTTCQEYVHSLLNCYWEKSACTFCPYAMSSAAGRQAVLERYRRQPQAGADTLLLEHRARALNSAQTLIRGSSAADMVRDAGLTAVMDLFEAQLAAATHALYEVRRLTRPAGNGGRAITARSIRILATGPRQVMAKRLTTQPGRLHTGTDGIARVILRERASGGVDHLYVAAPAGAEAKQRPGFEEWWQQATGDTLF